MPNTTVPADAEGVTSLEITNLPDHISDSVRTELLGIQDRLGKVNALITLVNYALMGMSGDDDGSMNALQAGMTEIQEEVTLVSMLIAEIRTRE